MNPHIFGRGSWIIFFQFFFFYMKNLIKKKNYINLIKDKNNSLEIRTKTLENFKPEYHYFILNHDEEEIIEKMYKNDLENFKKKLVILVSSLPCNDCVEHCLRNMNKNKVLESECFFYILHFFIELRNMFYTNKINRTLFNDEDGLEANEIFLFKILITD